MVFGKKRTTIGLIEPVTLEDSKEYKAKIDTGADSSSIDEALVKTLGDKKIIDHKKVRSALGKSIRPTIMLEIEFCGQKIKQKFSVSDRSQLKYKVLIGKDILKKGDFLIDPNKAQKVK